MSKHAKKSDLRDRKGPRTTVTDTDERLAGSEKPSVAPIKGSHMVSPGPDTKLPPGQGTKGS